MPGAWKGIGKMLSPALGSVHTTRNHGLWTCTVKTGHVYGPWSRLLCCHQPGGRPCALTVYVYTQPYMGYTAVCLAVPISLFNCDFVQAILVEGVLYDTLRELYFLHCFITRLLSFDLIHCCCFLKGHHLSVEHLHCRGHCQRHLTVALFWTCYCAVLVSVLWRLHCSRPL